MVDFDREHNFEFFLEKDIKIYFIKYYILLRKKKLFGGFH